jgi:hypothetical protein
MQENATGRRKKPKHGNFRQVKGRCSMTLTTRRISALLSVAAPLVLLSALFSLLASSAAYPQTAAPIFSDPLHGKTVGQARIGAGYETFMPRFATLNKWNSWVKYTSVQLPSTAGTVSFLLDLHDGFSNTHLLSDAYGLTVTGPSFDLLASKGAGNTYTLDFGYWNSNVWHSVAASKTLQTNCWYSVGLTWGAQGQSLWVSHQRLGHSSYSGAYEHGSNYFRSWGLGCVFNETVAGSPDPSPCKTACPASFSQLKVWNKQVAYGGTSQTATP